MESFKPHPYVTAVLSCAMWCFYGMPFVHPDSLLVITINGFGFIIEIIYITIFFFYSPWSKRGRVIRTKSVKYIPFFISLAYFCNGVIWVPNSCGAVLGLMQLILYASYYKSTPQHYVSFNREMHKP
ncbi:bidirectional sugar transporter sweet5 [Quercus suber]|uniref:Bidirectional sugar transporter sweet5 n=1 Tax=Quercus suber TaxID=58331 RepID=A0AAW0KDG2_QUESU